MVLARSRILWIACLLAILTLLSLFRFIPERSGSPSVAYRSTHQQVDKRPQASKFSQPTKPRIVKIIGLVFYGRKSTVSILDCYLKRNLVDHGGFLDEVLFVSRTDIQEDRDYLQELLKTSKRYRSIDLNEGRTEDYSKPWEKLEDGPMYIKIDDDVIFIEDGAIESMVTNLITHPEYFMVSANVVNQPALSWVHWHMGVVRPYLPEMTPPSTDKRSRKGSWRASELPEWSGPKDMDYTKDFKAPFEGHRWLPLPKGTPEDKTPITTTTYDKASRGWSSWAVAAQQHYSLLEHLENDNLAAYHLGMWDFKYDRISAHVLAFWGKDVRENLPFPSDDEGYLSEVLPKKLQRHAIVDGNAVAAHFSFGAQQGKVMAPGEHGMEWTDVLDRYRAYAQEKMCSVSR
ncbi:MAG: hypothetical protein M1823_000587 [Watsoniomyces obsoletus]|nr:MAG: hypothetical protein M1823_000587 [Watsoniomyces obsoletus]